MSLLRENAVLALFVCLALGYLVGRLRAGPIQLGGICGTLIVSMLIGARHVSVNADVKNVAFALFIFSLGYLAGPQFFANLNAKGLRFGVLSLLEAVLVISMALGIAKIGGLDTGTASGILAGSATESAVVGTAQEAISQLPGITPAQSTALQAHVATAYSVCYLFGLISIVLLTSQFFPMLLRINLADACRELWQKMLGAVGGKELAPHETAALPGLVGRTFQVTTLQGAGKSIAELEASVGEGASIEGVKRGAKLLTMAPDVRLEDGDYALVVGERDAVILVGKMLGTESPHVPGLESALMTRQVVVTRKDVVGRRLGELRADNPRDTEGIYVTGIERMEHQIPVAPGTELHMGDTVTVVGMRSKLDRFGDAFGAKVRTESADWIYIAAGICLGVLLGMVTVHAGSANLSLGTGGGCLIVGLIFGWLRAQRPVFGAYPPAAAQTIKDLGLSVFIAVTGMAAGPDAGPLLKQYPVLLPVSGVLMVVIPAFISLFVGRRFLRIEKPILIGAIAGQQCSTPAITAVGNVANSSVPMLGYTITYTLSNFLLPLTGPVLVGVIGLRT